MLIFCPSLVSLPFHPHRHTHPADLYSEIIVFPNPFDYLHGLGQCCISYCTFLLIINLADDCEKPYAFICRWHSYFRWRMRCPLFLIPFPLKQQMWSSDLMSTFSLTRLDKKKHGAGFVFLSLVKISLLHNTNHWIFRAKWCVALRYSNWYMLQMFTGPLRCGPAQGFHGAMWDTWLYLIKF